MWYWRFLVQGWWFYVAEFRDFVDTVRMSRQDRHIQASDVEFLGSLRAWNSSRRAGISLAISHGTQQLRKPNPVCIVLIVGEVAR